MVCIYVALVSIIGILLQYSTKFMKTTLISQRDEMTFCEQRVWISSSYL